MATIGPLDAGMRITSPARELKEQAPPSTTAPASPDQALDRPALVLKGRSAAQGTLVLAPGIKDMLKVVAPQRDPSTDAAPASSAAALSESTPAASRGAQKFLNIFWNQHQPYYKDEASDSFTAPWVRLHATKDYYDMAAILDKYPNVHVTINLSSSLLRQLDEYVDKLHDFADIESPHRGDPARYPEGHLDRYLDLTMKPVEEWTAADRKFALDNFFNADPEGQIRNQQGYRYLHDKKLAGKDFSDQDFRDLKVWFNLGWMDHMFQAGPVQLIGDKLDGTPMEPVEKVEDTARLIKQGYEQGYGNSGFTEKDAQAMVLDQYKIMKYVVPVHRHMQNKIAPDGHPQVEVVTTPFYHPILPLINDVNTAAQANPGMSLPTETIHAPEDADAQVAKGAEYYRKNFGHYPRGMWPGEGAVSESVVGAFQRNGIKWVATGNEVAMRSGFVGDNGLMYRIDIDDKHIDHDAPGKITDNTDAMSIVFRSMHDRIGFDYGGVYGRPDGKDAAWDFINRAKGWEHWNGVPAGEDVLVTNMADGENCWANYINDGHDFLNALYGALNDRGSGIATTTPTAFMDEHPLDLQWELEPLAAGTWVGGDFSTWIGESSENVAWTRLKHVRDGIVEAGVPRPDPHTEPPDPASDRQGYFAWKAWEALYAAEGSDWFWWYGNDQGDNSGSDARFADTHRSHMINTYVFGQKAGYPVPYPAEAKLPLDASGLMMEVPPITRDPKASRAAMPADGKTTTDLSIDAFLDQQDPQKLEGVYVDLSPINGPKRAPMTLGKDGRYHLEVTVPRNTPQGKVVLTFTATTDRHTSSLDYLPLEVTGGEPFVGEYQIAR